MKTGPFLDAIIVAMSITAAVLTAGCQPSAKDKSAVDPTGAWKVTISKLTSTQTLKLKREGDKLTGTIIRDSGGNPEELAVEEGEIHGDTVSFTTHQYAKYYQNNVLQQPDKSRMTHSKFQGKLSGDTMKGSLERDIMGSTHTNNWEAGRVRN